MTSPFQISVMPATRASPSTRRPYGSAQPHTIRPSQSITRMSHGQVQRKRVARKFRDTGKAEYESLKSSDATVERQPFASFFRYASSLSFSYFTVFRNRL